MNTEQVAKRLVELCREGKGQQAQDELYANDVESYEMEAMASGPLGNAKGLTAIREKGRQWSAGIEEVHGGTVGDPIIAGNWFSVPMTFDATMKGRGRVNMEELCVYHVRDGKIVREQFFYDAG